MTPDPIIPVAPPDPDFPPSQKVKILPTPCQVSVLVPARNAAATLDACLASLARQTLSAWHCVVVDDGSTDETAAVAARWARADARIGLVRQPHRGLVAALNTGLAHGRAPLVARMDADDLMRRDRLERQVAALEANPAWAAVTSGVRLFPRAQLRPYRREYEAWLNGLTTPDAIRRDAFIECPVAHPALMARREAFEAFSYRDMGWPEDYDLVLRWLAAGLVVGTVPRRLVAWRDSAERLSRTDVRYGLDRFVACKAHFLAEGFLADRDDYVLWGYGATGRAMRRALAAHGKRATHILEVKAGRIGRRIHGAEVVAVGELPRFRGQPILASVARPGP
ncbi:MAG: glycosyltransferase family 2 protein, partial [Vicinamibacteraceae bacterium]|nr:glycosyltransferase family 2 protein [Vicinamibacteraceae bacterium]